MNEVEQALRRLNKETFRAEAKESIGGVEWDAFLLGVLADDFVLRRSLSEADDESSSAMIGRIASTSSPTARTLLEHTVRTWTSDTLGVIASVVTLPGKDGQPAYYQNAKVFVAGPNGWQCTYWQVTARPKPRSNSD